ncbi:S1C family serine protease [Arthrobacter sp. Sr24]
MSENNGEHTTGSNDRSEQPEQSDAAPEQSDAAQAGQPDAGQAGQPDARQVETSHVETSQSETAASEVTPRSSAAHAAPATPTTAPRPVQQPWGQAAPSQPAQAQPAQSPHTQPQTQQDSGQYGYGVPVPPVERPSGYGAPTPTSNSYANPTERIPASPAHSAGSHSAEPNGAQSNTAESQSVGSQNPTEPIPNGFGAGSYGTSSFGNTSHDSAQGAGNHNTSTPNYGEGYAGPGYPASNMYPQSQPQPPGVSPQRNTKGGKKVGMGMFTTGVLAAALVGGLVGGGSLFLLNQQTDNSSANTTSQSAPLVVNNTNSVNQVTAAAAKAMPSVVTISATSGSSGGTGSGIILDTEGHILTNTHVVTLDGAAAHAAIQVQTSDNRVHEATIVGTDPLSDLAVIKIDAPDLVPAALGESSQINVGDTVIAIGSPLGLNATVTEGIVSTLNRTIQVASSAVPDDSGDSSQDPDSGDNGFQFSPPGGGADNTAATGTVNLNVIQTDAAINPGNSGGALVNAEGQIIGVNVAIASTGNSSKSSGQGGNIGVGFSIPMDHAKRVAADIIETGSATHGQLGVSVSGTSASGTSSAFSSGATVADVTAGSAADKAGLKKGDVISKLGNRTISDPSDLTAAVREQPGGATVKMDFTRDGKAQSIDIALDTMPTD